MIYGSADPGYLFGFNNTLRWKNFDLNVYFYGQFDKLSAGSYKKQWLSNNVNDLRRGYNQPTSISDLWSSSNPNGTLPGYFQTESAYGVGDYYYEKTWFIRCRNITLGYNIPIKTRKLTFQVQKVLHLSCNGLTRMFVLTASVWILHSNSINS